MKHALLFVCATISFVVGIGSSTVFAANFGVDAVHGFDASGILGSGANFDEFRATFFTAGHTITPLTEFTDASLAGLDAIVLLNSYSGNTSHYNPDEVAAIQNFVSDRAVFVSDSSIWDDSGSDRPITFGDNRQLLTNILNFLAPGGGALFVADDGGAFEIGPYNELIAPYGVQFATDPIDDSGRTVTNFLLHPITDGIEEVGVDFQLPITITAPDLVLDLTVGDGGDNILAVIAIPEPALTGLAALAVAAVFARRRSVR